MAFDAEQIRSTAQRVAASHGLDVVELEFSGGAKHRTLRIFIEKNAQERARIAEGSAEAGAGTDRLAGVTHEDCALFSQDFGTVLDVEDSIPGGEYTLEVSSPGLDRKLHGLEDYRRFEGSLVKVQTFEPVEGNRHWQGRLREASDAGLKLTIEGKGRKGSGQRARGSSKAAGHGAEGTESVEIALKNIEKAQLVPEF